jgi:hypothetical protein
MFLWYFLLQIIMRSFDLIDITSLSAVMDNPIFPDWFLNQLMNSDQALNKNQSCKDHRIPTPNLIDMYPNQIFNNFDKNRIK